MRKVIKNKEQGRAIGAWLCSFLGVQSKNKPRLRFIRKVNGKTEYIRSAEEFEKPIKEMLRDKFIVDVNTNSGYPLRIAAV